MAEAIPPRRACRQTQYMLVRARQQIVRDNAGVNVSVVAAMRSVSWHLLDLLGQLEGEHEAKCRLIFEAWNFVFTSQVADTIGGLE